ncbi:hypothetical protein QQ045_003161 [Rhodiola kirilowii]
MAQTCSFCGSMGHNSKTCVTYIKSTLVSPGFKLFGVQLDTSVAATSSMKKSCSVGCFSPSSSLSSPTLPKFSLQRNSLDLSTGYLSDDLIGHPRSRKKGVSWTEDEHRKFLAGLEKLGKGDWRGISKHFVPSRTPTQVASHAQKYFLRLNKLNKKRERQSLFSLQTEIIEKGNSNDPRNVHDCITNISETIWLKYANQYYADAFAGKTNYLHSPMSNLLLARWLYNSSGLSANPNSKYHLKPTIVEAEPSLELTLADPKQVQKKYRG